MANTDRCRYGAREQLLDVISFTECANQSATPDGLLNAFRDQIVGGAADMLFHSNPRTSPEFEAGVEWAVGMLRAIAHTTAQEG